MVNIGILGMGKMAECHAQWISENEGMQLAAICEKNETRAKEIEKKYNVTVFRDAESFLARNDIDLVVITTTNELHEKFSIQALRNKKNVIVEKPMCVNHEGTLRMIAEAEKSGKHLLVHQSSRWDRDFLLVREVMQSGIIGDFMEIQSNAMFCDEFWPSWGIEGMANPWRIKAEHFGGILLDWGTHLIDQILNLIKSDPIDVYGVLQNGVWTKEVDEHFFSALRFENGLLCQIEASNNARIPFPRWYIIGLKGTLTVPGKTEPFWDKAEIVYITEKGKREKREITFFDICESGAEGGFYKELVPFLEGKIKDFVSMYEVSKVMKVIDLIRESNRLKKSVGFGLK